MYYTEPWIVFFGNTYCSFCFNSLLTVYRHHQVQCNNPCSKLYNNVSYEVMLYIMYILNTHACTYYNTLYNKQILRICTVHKTTIVLTNGITLCTLSCFLFQHVWNPVKYIEAIMSSVQVNCKQAIHRLNSIKSINRLNSVEYIRGQRIMNVYQDKLVFLIEIYQNGTQAWSRGQTALIVQGFSGVIKKIWV